MEDTIDDNRVIIQILRKALFTTIKDLKTPVMKMKIRLCIKNDAFL